MTRPILILTLLAVGCAPSTSDLVPAARVYDMHGQHVRDVGRGGQGPGEYEQPNGLVVTDDGRLLVAEGTRHQILSYSPEGGHLDTWQWTQTGWASGARMLIAAPDGSVWTRSFDLPESGSFSEAAQGFRRVGPQGAGELRAQPEPPGFEPISATATGASGDRTFDWLVPFAPGRRASMDGNGTWYVGSGASYRFWVFDGDRPSLIVERHWQPVPVQHEEAAAFRRWAEADVRRMARNPDWQWTDPEISTTKPAYTAVVPDNSGRIWLQRPGLGRPLEDCDLEEQLELQGEAPCWTESRYWDVFQRDGSYLGEVPVPEGITAQALMFSHIQDDRVLLTRPDAQGNAQVVLYRLQLPETRRQ